MKNKTSFTITPASLLIYYGWPDHINQAHQTENPLQAAADEFSQYEYVVLGAGLEKTEHTAHDITGKIIALSQAAGTSFFGYVDLGVSTSGFPLREIKTRIRAWQDLGVAGIFLDDFGYDFLVSRKRQVQAVKYVHRRGMPVIACGWDPDQIFSRHADPLYNPRGLAAELNESDFYLCESYQVINGAYAEAVTWRNRSNKINRYRQQIGFQVLAVTTNDPANRDSSTEAYAETKFHYAWYSACLDNWHAIGWGEPAFAVQGQAPYRQPPILNIGTCFTGSLQEEGGLYSRQTNTGRIWIDTNSHTCGFKPAPVNNQVQRQH